MAPPTKFRISSKNIFLDYPRCPLTTHQALSQILTFDLPSAVKFIRVSRRLLDGGEPHVIALVQLESKSQIHGRKMFDLASRSTSARFHPVVFGAKSSSDVTAFIRQGGDFTDWGDLQIDSRRTESIAEAARNAGTKAEALAIIRETNPRFFVLQLHNIDSALDTAFAPPPPPTYVPYYPPTAFRITDDIQQWLAHNLNLNDNRDLKLNANPKSIVIEGPTRTGKTHWARSLGPHNYLAGFLDLNPEVYSNDARYNVIDGVNPSELKSKHWKELLGAKSSWQAKYKYCKLPRLIKGGIPTIVLCNPGDGDSYRDFLEKKGNASLKAWTLSHVEFVLIDRPLF